MTLEATKETGGCERLFSVVTDRIDRKWSIPLIPKVAQTTLRAAGSVEAEPSHDVLAVVRHPYLRLVSAWRFLPELEPWSSRWPEHWDEFLRELYDSDPSTLDRHLRPQKWFLDGVAIKQLVRLNMLTRHVLPPGFQVHNRTDLAIAWPDYDEDDYNRILTYYAEDMALFMAAIG